MARTEEILAFPCGFFRGVVAPLDLKELDHLVPCDTTLLIRDLDRMFEICQVYFEWRLFWQYKIHGCLQALLQLRYVEDVVNSCQRRW
jgi:hypothetical protein